MLKMTKLKLIDFLFFVLLMLAFFSLKYFSPPSQNSVHPHTNLEKTYDHLVRIARAPHPIGTKEHNYVKNYIVEQIKSLGLEPIVQKGITHNNYRNTPSYIEISNIYCLLPGTDSKGIVAVAGHYDSQPNTPGSADDGEAIASMLQLLESYKNLPHKNDILFLFTDGEETGLNGAKYFTENYERIDEVKYLFNFEARGNKGPILAFETSDNNEKIIQNLAKNKYIFGHSLMYEVYKLMPNDTDFSIFKRKGIEGISFAKIDGFVSYHSMTDTPENGDKNSINHLGILMAEMLGQYSNMDNFEKGVENVSYANLFGSGIIWHRGYWNWILWGTSMIMLVFYPRIMLKEKNLGIDFFKALGWTLLMLISGLLGTFLLQFIILSAYPHYNNFYSSNFYNSLHYIWAFLGISGLITFLLNHKIQSNNVQKLIPAATLFLLLIISLSTFKIAPSAVNFFIYPTFLFLVISIILKYITKLENSTINGISVIPAVIFWSPSIYLFYVTFSLKIPFLAFFFVLLILLLLIPLINQLASAWKWGLLALLVLGMMRAHGGSKISKKQPFQAQMHLNYNHNDKTTSLVSNDLILDFFESRYMKNPDEKQLNYLFKPSLITPFFGNYKPFTSIELISDTLVSNEIQKSYKLQFSDDLIKTLISVKDVQKISSIYVNGTRMSLDSRQLFTEFIFDSEHDTMKIEVNLKEKGNQLEFIFVRRGLLDLLGVSEDIIPGTGFYGGTIVENQTIDL